MPALTRNVLTQSLDQVAVWEEQGWRLTVAVNLSPSALSDATLADIVDLLGMYQRNAQTSLTHLRSLRSWRSETPLATHDELGGG